MWLDNITAHGRVCVYILSRCHEYEMSLLTQADAPFIERSDLFVTYI